MADEKKTDQKKEEKRPVTIPTFVPRTREEIALALEERKRDASALVPGKEPAGQAPVGAQPFRLAEPERPVIAPAPKADPKPLLDKRGTLTAKLRDAALAVEIQRSKIEAAKLADVEAAAQRERDRLALVNQQAALEAEAESVRLELAAIEATALADEAAREQARRTIREEQLPLDVWRKRFREAIEPMVDRVVCGLVKIKELQAAKGADLEKIASLKCPPGMDANTWSEYRAVSIQAGTLRDALQEHAVQYQRLLLRADAFQPDPRTSDGRSAVNALRLDLERTSGLVDPRALVDLPHPYVVLASAGVEGHTAVSADLTQKVMSLLASYARIQKAVNATTRPMPELVIELLPKERPRHEVMAELRGPKTEQTRAAGVPEVR